MEQGLKYNEAHIKASEQFDYAALIKRREEEMNLLSLKEYADGHLVYEYQPEGQSEAGEVFYDVAAMQGKLLKKAEGTVLPQATATRPC
jgi:hypothetical protein